MRWLVLLLLALQVSAEGWSTTHALSTGSVTVTNAQANSSWVPVAVLVRYEVPTTATVTVHRVSGSWTHVLGQCAFTNAVSAVWVPEAAYSFGHGEALEIRSSETNSVVQLIRRGD